MSTDDGSVTDDVIREFRSGVSRRELLLQYDAAAKRSQFFPRPVSVFSEGMLEWRASAGWGTLIAATTVHTAAKPYLVGIVQIDEGPRVLSRLLNADKDVHPGRRMRLTWEPGLEGINLYAFEPV